MKWEPGDGFSIPLQDGTLAYGQVLTKGYGVPTCALFELKTERPDKDLKGICGNRTITVLHLGPELLDKGIWVVLGNQPLSVPQILGQVESVARWEATHLAPMPSLVWQKPTMD